MAHPVTPVDLASNVRPGGTTQAANPHSVAGFRGEVAAELEAVATHLTVVDVVTEAGTAVDLDAAHFGKTVLFTAGTAVTLTVQDDADVEAQIGTRVRGFQMGAGAVTPTADAANAVRNAGATVAQYDGFELVKVAADEWVQVNLS